MFLCKVVKNRNFISLIILFAKTPSTIYQKLFLP